MRHTLSALLVMVLVTMLMTPSLLAAAETLTVSAIVLLEDDDHFVLPGTACRLLEGAIGNSGGMDNQAGIFLLLDCPTISKHTRLVERSQLITTANKVTVAPSVSVVVPAQP